MESETHDALGNSANICIYIYIICIYIYTTIYLCIYKVYACLYIYIYVCVHIYDTNDTHNKHHRVRKGIATNKNSGIDRGTS